MTTRDITLPTHGSGPHGLLCCFGFEARSAGQPLTLDQVTPWLAAQADRPAGFLWLHFNLADATALAWIRQNLPVVPEFFEALQDGSRSTRIEDAQDTLVAVVNDVAYEFDFDATQTATLWAFVNRHLVITARTHPLRSIDRLREAVRAGLTFGSSLDFLNRLLRDQGDVLTRIVRDATVKVDHIEDGLSTGKLGPRRRELGHLRRVLVRLQRLLAPEPGALFRLLHQPPPWITPEAGEALRQATEEFNLVLRDLSALQERIKLLQEEVAAQVGEQTNRNLFALTIVTVLALPINIAAGLFGMNVGGIPLAEHPHGFAIIVAIILTFTVLAGWWAFRRRE